MIPNVFEVPLPFGLGPLPIHSFGLMMVLAFLAAWQRLFLSLKAAGEDPAMAEQMVTWAAVGGIVGARLGYIVSYPKEFFEAPLQMAFGGAGFVFYGGLFGGAFAVWLFLKLRHRAFFPMSDIVAPCLAVGYAVGRIGCQLSGDGDYGRISALPWSMEYSLGVVPTLPGELHHPAPVYETFLALAITWLLISSWAQTKFSRTGQLFGLYLLLSACARFLVEIIRVEPRVYGELTQAQVVSICLCLIGILLIALPRRQKLSAKS